MKKNLLAVAAFIFAVLLAGCGKPDAGTSTEQAEQAFNGVQFCQDFASAPADLKTPADKAWISIQSGAFQDALRNLAKLEANPSLNAAQKTSVAGLTEQVKKQMAANSAGR